MKYIVDDGFHSVIHLEIIMKKKLVKTSCFLTITLFFILNFSVSAQKKDRIDIIPKISTETLAGKCKNYTLGTISFFPAAGISAGSEDGSNRRDGHGQHQH